jgi:hypothetical protein
VVKRLLCCGGEGIGPDWFPVRDGRVRLRHGDRHDGDCVKWQAFGMEFASGGVRCTAQVRRLKMLDAPGRGVGCELRWKVYKCSRAAAS